MICYALFSVFFGHIYLLIRNNNTNESENKNPYTMEITTETNGSGKCINRNKNRIRKSAPLTSSNNTMRKIGNKKTISPKIPNIWVVVYFSLDAIFGFSSFFFLRISQNALERMVNTKLPHNKAGINLIVRSNLMIYLLFKSLFKNIT